MKSMKQKLQPALLGKNYMRFKTIVNLFSYVKKGILFLLEYTHNTIPYKKNYFLKMYSFRSTI